MIPMVSVGDRHDIISVTNVIESIIIMGGADDTFTSIANITTTPIIRICGDYCTCKL